MIRRATTDDSSRIADIQVFGWRNAYRGIVDDIILFKKLNIEKKSNAIRESIENNKEEILVFEEDEIVKAMMIIGKSRDDDMPGAFELWCIYVDPMMMRSGIGSKMLAYCEREAKSRDISTNTLWVLSRNAIGRSFYEKNGYYADGKKQMIERLGVEEIRYVKQL